MAVPSQSSPFAAILSAVLTRLSAATGIDAAYVRLAASDGYAVTIAEPFFLFARCYEPAPQDGQMHPLADGGAGRLSTNVMRRFRVYVYTRSGVDTYSADDLALIGTDPGRLWDSDSELPPQQFAAEELVLNALVNWMPVDEDGNALCISPVRWETSDGPAEREPEAEEGLVRSSLDFGIAYQLSIDPRDPAV